ncbi:MULTISPECIES: hypothetical protein [unclassified Mycobacterium]|uniref:hypothetical protein n=1 Tax=unclassified Mycobacterium TaxID=2642494 RepID=UPI001116618B|nr:MULTISPECIES: hypothetical protein [unclassified Mycobacterium]
MEEYTDMGVVKRIRRLATVFAIPAAFVLAMADVAHAEPPGFPDVSGFVSDSPLQYPLPLSRSTDKAVRFSTPFGYTCSMNGWHVGCFGKQLPGYSYAGTLPASSCGQMISNDAAPARPAYFQPAPTYCQAPDSSILPSGHKIEYNGLTCAVGPDFTACSDNSQPEQRGFVLRQDGNSLLF